MLYPGVDIAPVRDNAIFHGLHYIILISILKKIHYTRDYPVDLEWEQPHFVLGTNKFKLS